MPKNRKIIAFLFVGIVGVFLGSCASSQSPTVERITPQEAVESLGARSRSLRNGIGCMEGNCENGKGTYVYAKKTKYSGEFRDGERNGQGTLQYENGDRYTGAFRNGKRSGHGKYFFVNGDIYEGEFSEGKRMGKGVYSFAEGGVLEAEFLDDGKRGRGLFYSSKSKDKALDCELRDYALYCLIEGDRSLVKKLRNDSSAPAPQSLPRSYFEGNR